MKSKIEEELMKATATSPDENEDREAWLERLTVAAASLSDDDWEQLSSPAQEWVNINVDILTDYENNDKHLNDFNDIEAEDGELSEEVEQNEEDTEEKDMVEFNRFEEDAFKGKKRKKTKKENETAVEEAKVEAEEAAEEEAEEEPSVEEIVEEVETSKKIKKKKVKYTNVIEMDNVIKVNVKENPKRQGTKAYKKFALIKDGMTVKEFCELADKHEEFGKKWGIRELRWCLARGYIELK